MIQILLSAPFNLGAERIDEEVCFKPIQFEHFPLLDFPTYQSFLAWEMPMFQNIQASRKV